MTVVFAFDSVHTLEALATRALSTATWWQDWCSLFSRHVVCFWLPQDLSPRGDLIKLKQA